MGCGIGATSEFGSSAARATVTATPVDTEGDGAAVAATSTIGWETRAGSGVDAEDRLAESIVGAAEPADKEAETADAVLSVAGWEPGADADPVEGAGAGIGSLKPTDPGGR